MTSNIDTLVPRGHKFACVACNGRHEIEGDIRLASGLWVLTHAPFGIGEHWTRWLGTLKADELEKASLLIFVGAPSIAPGVIDDENSALQDRVDRLYYALRLLGMYAYGDALTLNGANDEGRLSVRSIGRHEDVWQQGTRSVRVTRQLANRAEVIAAGMEGVSTTAGYGRVTRGFAAWQRGVRDDRLSFRLHQFVRSLDGLLKTPPGQGRAAFVERGQTLIGASDESADLLDELYRLRSGSEHLHEWDYGLDQVSEKDREARGHLRTFQAELIASAAYARLLETPDLQSRLRTDPDIDAFWDLGAEERASIWGAHLDLGELIRERYARSS